MIYEFNCEHCNGNFEVSLPMADCKKPLSEPCPLCNKSGKIFRVFEPVSFQNEMIGTIQKKAGLTSSSSEWGSVMKKIHKAAGSQSTMGDHI